MVILLDGTSQIAGKDVWYSARIINHQSVPVPHELLVDHVDDVLKILLETDGRMEKTAWCYTSTVNGGPIHYIMIVNSKYSPVKVEMDLTLFKVTDARTLKEVEKALYSWSGEFLNRISVWTNPELN